MAFNETVHQPIRLRVMSSLCVLSEGELADFTALRDALGLTDGNLGGHLHTLATAGYIEIEKSFVDQKPRTRIAATAAGRQAFLDHVLALQQIIREPVELARDSG